MNWFHRTGVWASVIVFLAVTLVTPTWNGFQGLGLFANANAFTVGEPPPADTWDEGKLRKPAMVKAMQALKQGKTLVAKRWLRSSVGLEPLPLHGAPKDY